MWGWEYRVGFPHWSQYCTLSWDYKERNFKLRRGGWFASSGGGRGVPTALSTLPRHVYITETSWKHTLFSLALWSQLVPESQAKSFPRITGILPSGLDQTEQNSHHSTCSGLSLFYLTWVHVCLLYTNILQPFALRMLSTKSPDLGLVWVERDWQEEWHHLAWNTFRVGKFSPSHLQTWFQCFMTHILYFHWGPAACKGKKKIQAQGFRSSILRILPTSP